MFFKEVDKNDLGDTIISNIFIDIFMPMANGLYVQVYLLGYRYACDKNANIKYNNVSLARNLDVPLSDIINAWKYWEQKRIVKIHQDDINSESDFSIEFIDLKKFYRENISNTRNQQSDTDRLIEAHNNPSIIRMFNSINKILGRSLAPSESTRLLDIMNEYNLNPDLIVYAYEYIKEKNGSSKPVSYVESVLRGWYDENIISVEEAKNSFEIRKERYSIYSKILNELGFYRSATNSEKQLIDIWIDKYEMSLDLIMYACSKSANISNPSISYINGIIKNYKEANITTVEEAQKEAEEFKSKQKEKANTTKNIKNYNNNKTPIVNTRYHNSFNEHFRNYTEDELEKKLLKVQNSKLKKNKVGD